jgi:hypothetical protein
VPTRQLSGGGAVRTYAATPDDFEARSASDAERARYGLHRRPDAPAELQERLEARARRYRFVTPRLRRRKVRRLELPRLRAVHGPDHGPEASGRWSGAVVGPAAGDRLAWVEAVWSVPAVAPPPGALDGKYCASTWIGLDGDGASSDVLQAGCDCNVSQVGGAAQPPTYEAWWQWFPATSQSIGGMAVSAGDELDCLIALAAGSTKAATIHFANRTSGVSHVFDVTAQPAARFRGNCAEWIVEAYGGLAPLASYGQIDFRNCNAGSAAGATVPAGGGNPIILQLPGGGVVSTGAIVSPTEVRVTYG